MINLNMFLIKLLSSENDQPLTVFMGKRTISFAASGPLRGPVTQDHLSHCIC